MLNFSALPRDSLLGWLLRLPLGLVPKRAVLPICQGRLRGRRWIAGSGLHAYWLGCYEPELQDALAGSVHSGGVVYDVGAHAGFFTLLASVLVGPHGSVYAFEPLPENVVTLRGNLRLNRVANAAVMEAALGDRCGTVPFHRAPDTFRGRTGTADGDLHVAMLTLDHVVAERALPPPTCIKIDVEGDEGRVLAGGLATLARCRPAVLVSVHGDDSAASCRAMLEELAYIVEELPTGAGESGRTLAAR
jgi:FkbM family methyltransferase